MLTVSYTFCQVRQEASCPLSPITEEHLAVERVAKELVNNYGGKNSDRYVNRTAFGYHAVWSGHALCSVYMSYSTRVSFLQVMIIVHIHSLGLRLENVFHAQLS